MLVVPCLDAFRDGQHLGPFDLVLKSTFDFDANNLIQVIVKFHTHITAMI